MPDRPAVSSVRDLLHGQAEIDTAVNVRGWVRTRRDSKAGLSFIQLHDGSCFDPIQIVAPADLPNYESEIRHVFEVAPVERPERASPDQRGGRDGQVDFPTPWLGDFSVEPG